jgi:hypothetical protein
MFFPLLPPPGTHPRRRRRPLHPLPRLVVATEARETGSRTGETTVAGRASEEVLTTKEA